MVVFVFLCVPIHLMTKVTSVLGGIIKKKHFLVKDFPCLTVSLLIYYTFSIFTQITLCGEKNMKKLLLYFICICIILSNTTFTYAKKKTNEPKIQAKAAVVMDATTGQVLYHKSMYKKKYPASLTKLMTVLLTLENCDLNEKVKFSKEAVFGIEPGSSNIGILPGEVLTVEQCLYGMMLESANEVCSAVAEHISGSVDEFAKLMTKRAKQLGCKNTHFTNANGLHNDDHYTTAYDLSLIVKELLKNPTFRKVSGSRNYLLKKTNKHPARWLGNHHKMIRYPTGSVYSLPEPLTVTSGKTAFTMKAKTCLSTSATDGEMELICIVMDDSGVDVYWDTMALFNYIFKNYHHVMPLQSYHTMPTEQNNIIMHNFFNFLNPQTLDLTVDKNYIVTLPKKASLSDVKTIVTKDLDSNANTIGTLHILYQEEEVGATPIQISDFTAPPIAPKQEEPSSNMTISSFIKKNPLLLLGSIGIGVCALFFYIRLSIKRRSLRLYPRRRKRSKKHESEK